MMTLKEEIEQGKLDQFIAHYSALTLATSIKRA